jgi:hypothetical protein
MSELRRVRPTGETLMAFDVGSHNEAAAVHIDERFTIVDEGRAVIEAVSDHRSRLSSDDAEMLYGVLAGGKNSGGSMARRARARALLEHPTSSVMKWAADDSPIPRPLSVPDVDTEAEWLALNPSAQPGWHLLAACSGQDQASYFPERGVAIDPAVLRRCEECPVRLDCLAVGVSMSQRPGLWGGHSGKSRRAVELRVRNLRAIRTDPAA